jgi:DNA polymerase III delta subunit
MKLRPEILFTGQIPSGCLLYGNNPAIEDFLILELIPQRLNAKGSEIKTFLENELLEISKEKLYLESSLFESPKLYIIKDVTDKFLPLIQTYAFLVPIVMVGRNLKSNNKIVTYVCNHPTYQAVGIYGDEIAFLSSFIKYQLQAYNIKEDVVGAILAKVDTFSMVAQQVKLLQQFYSNGTTLTAADIEKVLIPPDVINIFKISDAVISKNLKVMIDVFQKSEIIFQKEMIPLLRVIAKQLWSLLEMRRQIDLGQSAQQTVSSATPMIPFNRRPQVIHNLSKWSVGGLLKAIVKLDEMEILTKQSHQWSTDLMERNFLQMTKY